MQTTLFDPNDAYLGYAPITVIVRQHSTPHFPPAVPHILFLFKFSPLSLSFSFPPSLPPSLPPSSSHPPYKRMRLGSSSARFFRASWKPLPARVQQLPARRGPAAQPHFVHGAHAQRASALRAARFTTNCVHL